jgi:prophage tail gpP-like protein
LPSIRKLKSTHTQSSTTLKPTLAGSYILTYPKKDTSTQTTNFVVSIANPAAYAMMATLAEPIKVTLPTSTTTRGHIRQQIATINLTTHTRSILGRTYAELLADLDITQVNINLPPQQYNQTKGLIRKPIGKMA